MRKRNLGNSSCHIIPEEVWSQFPAYMAGTTPLLSIQGVHISVAIQKLLETSGRLAAGTKDALSDIKDNTCNHTQNAT